jgi:hypothetical protein
MGLSYAHVQHVDGPSNNTTSITSAPFTVAQYQVLAGTVGAESYEGQTSVVVTTEGGRVGGFTDRADRHAWDTGGSHEGAYSGTFGVRIEADASGVVVRVVTAGSPAGWKRPSMDIWLITGADRSDWSIRAEGYGPTVGGPLNLLWTSSNDPPGANMATLAVISCVDAAHSGAPYMAGDGITPGNGYSHAPGPGVSGVATIATWNAPAGTKRAQVQEPNWPGLWATTMLEIRAAHTAPIVDAGADRDIERTKGIIRTAGEPSDGGAAITARQWRLMSGPGGSGAPVDLPAYQGDPKRVLLPSTVAGAHVVRYTATNAVGPGYDEATITVTPLRPTVNAGPDVARAMGVFTRTATETAGDSAITARAWKITAGPSHVGDVIGTAAALSWTPPSLGQWTLQYTATSAAGISDPDTCVISVGVSGVPLKLNRTPAPKLAVAIAFGGNLSDPDGSEWVFTEVTTDVRVEQGVHLRHGRSDEAGTSQPAQIRFALDNRTGKYSLGGRSPYWPNIRQGTPIQVSCDLGAGFVIMGTAYADGFTPAWSVVPLTDTGQPTPGANRGGRGDAIVLVSASGDLRRLQQGQPPVISPLRRGLSVQTPGVVAYWPCEDEQGARFLASAIQGHPPMDFSGRLHGGSNPGLPAATPRLAESDVFACSGPLPKVSDSEWYGDVPDYTGTEIIQLRCLIDVPDAGSINGTVILGLITSGDPGFWELRYMTGGAINVRAWRNFSSLVCDSPVAGVNLVPNRDGSGFVGLDGRRGQLGLTLTKSGANIDWVVDFIESGATTGYVYGPGMGGTTVPGASVGKARRVQTCTDGGHVDVTLGHIVVRRDARDTPMHVRQLNAWNGEIVGERLVRLRDENGLWYAQWDPPPPYYPQLTDTMGPQPRGTVLDLYRDCERTDGGLLWDGVGPGLSYTTKRYREAGRDGTGAPALTLNAAAGEVGLPFSPAHDDAYRVNRFTAQRRYGSTGLFEDTTGPLGSGVVGRYDDSREVGVRDDSALVQYAGWAVGQGTVEGYRYPRLSLNLTRHPQLLDEWLPMIPGDRVDVTGLALVNPAAPVETVSLAVEGFEQTIYPDRWDVIMNTSLFDRWAVAQVAAETTGGAGDPRSELVARVDTNATVIAELTTVGQGTLKVNVTAGPLWTTTATRPGDFPFLLDVGAVPVRVTGCSGTANPQTFTCDPMPVSRPAGTAVRLWHAPVFGL